MVLASLCRSSEEPGRRASPAISNARGRSPRRPAAASLPALPTLLALAALGSGCAALRPADAPATLDGTRWQLERLASMDDSQGVLQVDAPERYTIEFGADGRLLARLDCQRGQGSWQATAAPDATPRRRSGSLQFGPLALTRNVCPPGSLAPRVARDLGAVRSFVLEGGRLHLALMADGGILSWRPATGASP